VPFVAVVMVLGGLAGCGGGGSRPAGAGTPTATALVPTSCPGAHQASAVGRWPAPVPASLPKPPSGTRARVTYRNFQLTVVAFHSRLSLRESVLFVLNHLPPAGYVIGRGDAEPAQADAPFSGPGVFGQIRLDALAPCRTRWLVAIGAARGTGGSPLLPKPSASASPVPLSSFGFGG
jgi:hypothetical protein